MPGGAGMTNPSDLPHQECASAPTTASSKKWLTWSLLVFTSVLIGSMLEFPLFFAGTSTIRRLLRIEVAQEQEANRRDLAVKAAKQQKAVAKKTSNKKKTTNKKTTTTNNNKKNKNAKTNNKAKNKVKNTKAAPTPSPTRPPTDPPTASPIALSSAKVLSYGDIHFVTFDGLEYDCHAPGELVLVKSLDSPFQIQARATEVGAATVTSGVAIQEYTGTAVTFPLVQVSMNTLAASDSTATVNGCPVSAYVDGTLIGAFSEVASISSNVVQATLVSSEIVVTYPSTGLEITLMAENVGGECYFSAAYQRSTWSRNSETVVGILGTPTGTTSDDWTLADGTVLALPEGELTRSVATTEYCAEYWCLRDAADSLFTYEAGTDFATFENCDKDLADLSALLTAIDNASAELNQVCGDDVGCLIDGVSLGVEAAEQYLDFKEENIDLFPTMAPQPLTPVPTIVATSVSPVLSTAQPTTSPEPTGATVSLTPSFGNAPTPQPTEPFGLGSPSDPPTSTPEPTGPTVSPFPTEGFATVGPTTLAPTETVLTAAPSNTVSPFPTEAPTESARPTAAPTNTVSPFPTEAPTSAPTNPVSSTGAPSTLSPTRAATFGPTVLGTKATTSPTRSFAPTEAATAAPSNSSAPTLV